jgi:hypothetical protein
MYASPTMIRMIKSKEDEMVRVHSSYGEKECM